MGFEPTILSIHIFKTCALNQTLPLAIVLDRTRTYKKCILNTPREPISPQGKAKKGIEPLLRTLQVHTLPLCYLAFYEIDRIWTYNAISMDLQSTAITVLPQSIKEIITNLIYIYFLLGIGIEPITSDLKGHRSTYWANRVWRRKESNFQPLDFQSSALPLSYVVLYFNIYYIF